MIDRSQVVEALVGRSKDINGNHSGRDVGIQLGGSIVKIHDRSFIDYKVGVFNGEGFNIGDQNQNKDIAARLIIHPVAGLDIGGACYDGMANLGDTINIDRNRYGFDLNYGWKNLGISGEYIYGKDAQKEKAGYYLQAGYFFLQKKLQVVAKYDAYNPDKEEDGNTSTLYTVGVNYNFSNKTKFQINYTFKEEESKSIADNYASFQFQIGF